MPRHFLDKLSVGRGPRASPFLGRNKGGHRDPPLRFSVIHSQMLLQRIYVVLGLGIVHKRCWIGSVEVFLNVSVSITILVL